MAKFNTWIKAARLRTLLLSFSGVLLGGFLSIHTGPSTLRLASGTAGSRTWLCLTFCALTAMLLQMLCNFANDYGDFKKGVDGAHRVGPQRELQSGEISEKEMRKAMAVVAAICLISGALLLFVFAGLTWKELAVFAALGIE
jgi:1,4-dihydroxy-2-naphthoate octaprenyltransferase